MTITTSIYWILKKQQMVIFPYNVFESNVTTEKVKITEVNCMAELKELPMDFSKQISVTQ